MKKSSSARSPVSLRASAPGGMAIVAAAVALTALLVAAQGVAAQGAMQRATPEENAAGFRLDEVQWKNRVLLLFAPIVAPVAESSEELPEAEQHPDRTGEGSALRGQRRYLRAAPDSAFAERDLLLVQVPARGRGQWRGWGSDEAAAARAVSAEAIARLRERFGVAEDAFALILVGKDGTEKRRDEAPVPLQAIFDEIDAMPMRQRELRRQRNPRQRNPRQ